MRPTPVAGPPAEADACGGHAASARGSGGASFCEETVEYGDERERAQDR